MTPFNIYEQLKKQKTQREIKHEKTENTQRDPHGGGEREDWGGPHLGTAGTTMGAHSRGGGMGVGGPQWRPDVPMGWDPTSPNVLNGIPAPPMAPRCPRGMGPRCPQHHSDVHTGWDRGAIQVSPWGGTQTSPVAPRRPHGMAPDVHVGWDRGVTQMSPWDGRRCPQRPQSADIRWDPNNPTGWDPSVLSPLSPRRPHGMGPRRHPDVPMGWDTDVPSGTQVSPWDGTQRSPVAS